MASSSPLADLTEQFFLCSVCLDQFKEPKLLPCLHRYCRDCLETIIKTRNEKTFECPICKRNCEVSKDGVDGFKTDFHMKGVIEFLQLQKSFDNTDVKGCASCSKKLKVSAYCFKCRVFLCDQCEQFHRVNIMFKDHKQHILSVENTENMKSMMEKLTSLTQNPRCNHHVEQEALLCCGTCGNIPVCMICVYGKHKGHDLHDVTEEAERERESLKMTLLNINQHKDKLYGLPTMIEKSMNTLRENVKNETEKINRQHEQQVKKILDNIQQTKVEREKNMEDLKGRRNEEINEIRRKHEEQMKQVEEKYDQELNKVDKKHSEKLKELERKVESLDDKLKKLTAEKEKMSKQNEMELKKISEYCEQVMNRYENFTATTSSILASNDKWADAQCIPDIRAASELLIEEMKKEFPELESLSNFKISDISADVVVIEEKYESVIDVGLSLPKGKMYVDSVTSISDGNIVITGTEGFGYSFITVFNRDGKVQGDISLRICLSNYNYCYRLSEFKVAILNPPREVSIYDVRSGSYNTKNMKKIIPDFERMRCTCVTTDRITGHIYIGTRGRAVYVVDDQLNYYKTIQLPDAAGYQLDISLHEGNLLVCSNSKSAYEVTLDESSSHVVCELIKPDLDGSDWRPSEVCTDKNGYIYMLWKVFTRDKNCCVLLQYSRDGRRVLTQIQLDSDSNCMTTVERDDGEFLMVATFKTKKIYTYRLTEKWNR